MESIIRNVKDIEGDKKEWLEATLHQDLSDHHRVLIMVLTPGVQADETIREKAMADLKRLSDSGTKHRNELGVSDEVADEILDEAIRQVRHNQRNP